MLCAALLLELFVFNFRHWESLLYSEIPLPEYDEMVLDLDESGGADVVIPEIGAVLNNIYFDCEILDKTGEAQKFQTIGLQFYGRDAANSEYFHMGDRQIHAGVERTKYIKLNLLGEALSLGMRVTSDYDGAKQLRIYRLALNARTPLMFMPLRFLAVLFALAFVVALRPDSPLYRVSFDQPWRGRRLALAALALGLCGVLAVMLYMNGAPTDSQERKTQYHELTRALANGQLYLEEEPSEALKSMENPYDADLRQALLGEKGFKRDHAYFNGRYYCYFGVLPVLLTYLPFYLVTGRDMRATYAMAMFGVFMVLGMCLMVYELFRRNGKKLSFALYVEVVCAMLLCSGLYFGFRSAKFYNMPILCAMGFALWGLYFWLCGARMGTERGRGLACTAIGSLCVALTVLARPQFIFSCLFVFPIYDGEFRRLFGRKGFNLRFWLCLILPVIPVAAATMWYNYARFGSPLDFGATYNLCAGDMRVRGWRLDRVFLSVFYYLFAPVITKPVFPFLENNARYTQYLGTTICENGSIFGGLFALMPFLMLCFMSLRGRNRGIQDPQDRRFARLALVLGLVIMLADAQVAGIVARYRMDFGWLFTLSAMLVCMDTETRFDGDDVRVRLVRLGLVVSILVGLCYELLLLMREPNLIRWWHPRLYHAIRAAVEFWL